MTMPPKIANFIHMAQKPRRWYIYANINSIKRHNFFNVLVPLCCGHVVVLHCSQYCENLGFLDEEQVSFFLHYFSTFSRIICLLKPNRLVT